MYIIFLLLLICWLLSAPVFLVLYLVTRSNYKREKERNIELSRLLGMDQKQGLKTSEIKAASKPTVAKVAVSKPIEKKSVAEVHVAPNRPVPSSPIATGVSVKRKKYSPYLILMYVGVAFIILAGIIFATTTWRYQTPLVKTSLLAGAAVLFYGAFALSYKKFKILQSSVAFYILGSAALATTVIAIGYFKLFGLPLEQDPFLLSWSIAFAVLVISAILSYRIYKKKISLWFAMVLVFPAMITLSGYIGLFSSEVFILPLLLAVYTIILEIGDEKCKSYFIFGKIPEVVLVFIALTINGGTEIIDQLTSYESNYNSTYIQTQSVAYVTISLIAAILTLVASMLITRASSISRIKELGIKKTSIVSGRIAAFLAPISLWVVFAVFNSSVLTGQDTKVLATLIEAVILTVLAVLVIPAKNDYYRNLKFPIMVVCNVILGLLAVKFGIINLTGISTSNGIITRMYPLFSICIAIYWTAKYIIDKGNRAFYASMILWPVAIMITSRSILQDLEARWMIFIPALIFMIYIVIGKVKENKWLTLISEIALVILSISTFLGSVFFSSIDSTDTEDIVYCVMAMIVFFFTVAFTYKKKTGLALIVPYLLFTVSVEYITEILDLEMFPKMILYSALLITSLVLGRVLFKKAFGAFSIDFLSIGAPLWTIYIYYQGNPNWKFIAFIMLALCFIGMGYKRGEKELVGEEKVYSRGDAITGRISETLALFALVRAYFIQPFIVWPEIAEYKIGVAVLMASVLVLRFVIWKVKSLDWFVYGSAIIVILGLMNEAILYGRTFDAIFIAGIALIITVFSFYRKKRKWFILGVASLVTIGVYFTRDFWLSLAWWIYLLGAGTILLVIAVRHETKKRNARGKNED